MTQEQLDEIINKPGYSVDDRSNTKKRSCVQSTIGKGVQSTLTRKIVLDKAGGEGKVPVVECGAGPKSVRPKDFAVPHPRRCNVSIQVFRRRLTDTGNDCWKYHLDACRYLGWLEDDNDATIRLTEEPHVKVETNDDERVEITLQFEGIDLNDLIEYYKDGPRNQP